MTAYTFFISVAYGGALGVALLGGFYAVLQWYDRRTLDANRVLVEAMGRGELDPAQAARDLSGRPADYLYGALVHAMASHDPDVLRVMVSKAVAATS